VADLDICEEGASRGLSNMNQNNFERVFILVTKISVFTAVREKTDIWNGNNTRPQTQFFSGERPYSPPRPTRSSATVWYTVLVVSWSRSYCIMPFYSTGVGLQTVEVQSNNSLLHGRSWACTR